MSKRAIDWVNSLSRKTVRGTERDVLMAYAELIGTQGACFASNETIAQRAGISWRHVIRCKTALEGKELLVRAKAPRFKTETKWYLLPVGCAELGIDPHSLQDNLRSDASAKVSTTTTDKLSPYIGLREEKTKASATSSARKPTPLNKSRVSPSAKEKSSRSGGQTTGKPNTARDVLKSEEKKRVSVAAAPVAVDPFAVMFEEFWQFYPLKKHKAQAEDIFYRLIQGADHFRVVMAGLEEAIDHDWDGHSVPLPHKWLAHRRWKDEFYETPKKEQRVAW